MGVAGGGRVGRCRGQFELSSESTNIRNSVDPKRLLIMSKKHQKVLSAIFSDHLSGNLHYKEIESMLLHQGAEFREGSGSTQIITLNGKDYTLHHSRHHSTLSKQTLYQLRKFLESAGISIS